jgi:hypothetical protein
VIHNQGVVEDRRKAQEGAGEEVLMVKEGVEVAEVEVVRVVN